MENYRQQGGLIIFGAELNQLSGRICLTIPWNCTELLQKAAALQTLVVYYLGFLT